VVEVAVTFVLCAGAFISFEQPVIKEKHEMQNKLCKIIFFMIADFKLKVTNNLQLLNLIFLYWLPYVNVVRSTVEAIK